jgi:hypothetical protein
MQFIYHNLSKTSKQHKQQNVIVPKSPFEREGSVISRRSGRSESASSPLPYHITVLLQAPTAGGRRARHWKWDSLACAHALAPFSTRMEELFSPLIRSTYEV